MAKTKPISIAEADKAPTFLPELDLARLNAVYFQLLLSRQTAEHAAKNFQDIRERYEAQLKSAQRTANVEFKEWDTNTGQLK